MGHTYCSSYYHCVFSTKERRPLIAKAMQERLWAFMGGVAREQGVSALGVGGTEDHVHLLLSLPSTCAVASVIREVKSGSSRWMRKSCGVRQFAWQEGYGAFSIGAKQTEAILAYIRGQAEHHRKWNFQEEFLALLSEHQMEHDPRYVWG